MTAQFRPATKDDRMAASVAISGFIAAFDGKARVSDALANLVSGLRDSFLERDVDGDADVLVAAIDRALHAHVVLSGDETVDSFDPNVLPSMIDRRRSEVVARIDRLREVMGEITSVMSKANPYLPQGFPDAPAMPEAQAQDMSMVRLRRQIEDLAEEQFTHGVLTDPGGGWPTLHPSLIVTLRKAFDIAREAIPAAANHDLVMYRRARGHRLVCWPKPTDSGPHLGLREIREANDALSEILAISQASTQHLSHLMGVQARQRLDEQRAEKMAQDIVEMRGRILKIPGLLDGLGAPATIRLRQWLTEGTPFPLLDSVKARTSPSENAIRNELRRLFGGDLQQSLRAAMFGEPERSLRALHLLHDRLSARANHPASRPDAPCPTEGPESR